MVAALSSPDFKPAQLSLRRQAVPLPNSARPGSSAIYRNAVSPDKLLNGSPLYKERTLYHGFQRSLRTYSAMPCMGHRPRKPDGSWAPDYIWETYGQVGEKINNFGAGVHHIYNHHVLNKPGPLAQAAVAAGKPGSSKAGLGATDATASAAAPEEKWHMGLYSVNRPEWLIAEGACNAHSLVSVALYDTLGEDTLEFIVNHAELRVVVTSADKIAKLLRVRNLCPNLKAVISMDPLSSSAGEVMKAWAQEKNLALYEFSEVIKIGAAHPVQHKPPSPADMATICYTSGTTGNPKGVMLTHGNLASQDVLPYYGKAMTNDDVHISYLPLAHIFERAIASMALASGARIGFYRGDVDLLIEDIATLKPTVFVSVPRLFNRVYAKVRAATIEAPGLRGILFRRAVADKLARLERGEGYKHAFWDGLLFNKVRAVLGGRVDFMISGSAPLSKDVMQFLRVVFASEVLEGYGQTENGAAATIQIPGENTAGHVGAPIPCCEVKLMDVPEMQYMVTDKPFPRGEICLRGNNVFLGYYKDPEKTRDALEADGWLHTGDIGQISDRGTVAIIDRKKAIFKLSQGEYIAPEKIENVYVLSKLVAQIYVHGDSLQSQLVGVVVPELEALAEWAKAKLGRTNVTPKDAAALCADPAVVRGVLRELDEVAASQRLQGFERIKAIYLDPEEFSVDRGMLTPSFKLKRADAAKYYRKQIDAMYASLAAAHAAGSGGHERAKL